MGLWYVMYCVGLIISIIQEVKGLTKILFDVTHSENEIIIHAKFHAY